MSKVGVVVAFTVGLAAGWAVTALTQRGDDHDGHDHSEHADEHGGDELAKLRSELTDARNAQRDAEGRAATAESVVGRLNDAVNDLQTRLAQAIEGDGAADPADGTGDDAPAWKAVLAEWSPIASKNADEAVGAALDAMDWAALAENMAAMAPVLPRIAEATAAGEPLPPDVRLTIVRHNQPLQLMALRADKDGVPGTGPNGSFTHPAITVNAMAAALEVAGLPLDARQKERFGTIGDRFVEQDRTRLGGYTDETLQLTRLIGETRLKQELVDQLREELTPEQREALSPAASRDRLGLDLFGAGLTWSGRVQGIQHTSLDDLVERVTGSIAGGLQPAYRDAVLDEVRAWAEGLPRELVERSADAWEQKGWADVRIVMETAEHVETLVKSLLAHADLPTSVTATLRRSPGTFLFDRPSGE